MGGCFLFNFGGVAGRTVQPPRSCKASLSLSRPPGALSKPGAYPGLLRRSPAFWGLPGAFALGLPGLPGRIKTLPGPPETFPSLSGQNTEHRHNSPKARSTVSESSKASSAASPTAPTNGPQPAQRIHNMEHSLRDQTHGAQLPQQTQWHTEHG